MEEAKRFSPGDRVRVDEAWFVADVAGRSGTVAAYPDGASPQPGCVWVELDVIEWVPGTTDGAEVEATFLRHL
jgi:hypothetical protein